MSQLAAALELCSVWKLPAGLSGTCWLRNSWGAGGHMQLGWMLVHTNRGYKVLLVQTAGVKVAGSSARGHVVRRQLQLRNVEEPLRPQSLHPARWALLAARAARAVRGAALTLLWV